MSDTKKRTGKCNPKYKGHTGDSTRADRRRNLSDDRTVSKSAANDVSWYARIPSMITDVCRVPMNIATGVAQDIVSSAAKFDNKVIKPAKYNLPGIVSAAWVPSVGYSSEGGSAINVAARSIFSFIRHVNSGTINYEQADVVMYLTAMDSIYTWYQHLVRAYGLTTLSNPLNRYWTDALLRSMHIDPKDARNNRDVYLGQINALGAKIATIFCPNTFSFMTRHMWLSSGVYLDRNSPRAQMYVFHPSCFLRYNPRSEGGGSVDMRTLDAAWESNSEVTLGALINAVNEMMGEFLTDGDIAKISGDILAAYGVENMIKVGLVPKDYIVQPAFQPEVLTQIQNMCWVDPADHITQGLKFDAGEPADASVETGFIRYIWQKDNVVYSKPTLPTPLSAMWDPILAMPMDDPTPADIMVATRDMFCTGPADDTTKRYPVFSGTEIFTTVYLYADPWDSKVGRAMQKYVNVSQFDASMTYFMTNFYMHPTITYYSITETGVEFAGIAGELNNVLPLTAQNLRAMHENAILGEFNITTTGLI